MKGQVDVSIAGLSCVTTSEPMGNLGPEECGLGRYEGSLREAAVDSSRLHGGTVQVVLQALAISLVFLSTALLAAVLSVLGIVAWAGVSLFNGLRRRSRWVGPPSSPTTVFDAAYPILSEAGDDWAFRR